MVYPIPLVPITGMGDTAYMQQMKKQLQALEKEERKLNREKIAIQKAIKEAEATWKSVGSTKSSKSSRKKGGKRISRKKK